MAGRSPLRIMRRTVSTLVRGSSAATSRGVRKSSRFSTCMSCTPMTLIYDRHRSLSTHVLHVLHVLSYTGAMRTTKPSRTAYNTALGATAHILLFEHRMTRKQLAQHLGVAQSVISRKLRGQVTWTAEELAIMASLFDLKLDDITPVRSGENWVPAVWKPDMQKAPVPVRTEASGVVAGTGFEPATSGL